MTARPENEFPTIRDARDRLAELVELGFGDLPVQILIVPDTTLQALARDAAGERGLIKPALMIEFECPDRMGLCVTSTAGITGESRPGIQ